MSWSSINAGQAAQWTDWLWMTLAGVWLVLWFGTKSAKKSESPWERVQHLIPLVIGFWLLFGRSWDGLNTRLAPDVPAVLWAGLALTAAGVAISVWARVSLGTNWSGVVTLKEGHELIRKGLYRWIRHPIYSGLLLAMIGTAIVRGRARGWVGFLIVLAAYYFKARREENYLRQEFGEKFEEHTRNTGMFLPKWT